MTVDRLVPVDFHVPPGVSVPERVLLAWHPVVLEKAVAYTGAEDSGARVGGRPVHVGAWAGEAVGIVAPGPGAAATALVADALHAGGVRLVVGVGHAWRITPVESEEKAFVVREAVAADAVTPTRLPEDTRSVRAFAHVAEAVATGVHGENVAVREGVTASVDAPAFLDAAGVKRASGLGASYVDSGSAPLLALARRHGFRAGAVLVESAALVRSTTSEWRMEDGGSPVDHGWFPLDADETGRVTRAAVRGTLGALLGDLAMKPEPEA